MPSTNWRVPNGPVQMHGQVSGGEAVAAVGTGGGDWRNQLPSGSRHRIVYKIMDTMRRHHPLSGVEGLLDLKRSALLFEQNIFTAATSPTDYLRKISLNMLEFEQNHPYINSYASNNPSFSGGEFHGVLNNNIPSTAVAASGMEGSNWRTGVHPQARQSIVNKIVRALMTHLPCYNEEGLQKLKNIAAKFEEYVYGVATGQCDYLNKIYLKMIAVERKYGHLMANSRRSNSASSSRYPLPLNPGYPLVYRGPTHMPPNYQ